MILKTVFLIVLILIFVKIFVEASWRIKKRRINPEGTSGKIMSAKELCELGEKMSEIKSEHGADCRSALKAELRAYYEYITSVYKQLCVRAAGKLQNPDAAQWLLDNYYIIEKEIGKIEKSLSSYANKTQTVVKEGKYASKPIVYAFACELAAHRMAQIDYDGVCALLGSYTKNAYLKSDEIWLFFDMLKLVFIKNIAYLCKKIRFCIKEYDYAEKYVKFVMEKRDNKEQLRRRTLRYFERGRISASFVSIFECKTEEYGADGALAISCMRSALEKRGLSMQDMILGEQSAQLRYGTDMGSCIRSVTELETLDMQRIFDEVSGVVKILKKDPDGTYSRLDDESKKLYVSAVCEIAERAQKKENETVCTAYELANNGKTDRERSMGYYLVSDGRNELFQKLGAKKERHIPVWAYIAVIWGIALMIGVFASVVLFPVSIFISVSVGFFITLLASQFASNAAGSILMKKSKAKILPKLDFQAEIPKDCRTFAVTVSLLTSRAQADRLVCGMEDFYILNRQNNLYFAVLADYKDSAEAYEDSALYDYMRGEVRKLNEKYSFNQDKFYFLMRKKTYSEGEKKWMGAERKRGAICDFVRLLKSGDRGDFINASDAYAKMNIKYVITLDADTRLRHNSAAHMTGAMAHPVNMPEIDEKTNIVTRGYGIMQPRIGIDIESAGKTFFTKVHTLCGGLDAYSGAASDLYQDIFGEAIFVGKGIFDADVFYRALDRRFPKEKILSHDLLEGSYLRCALLSDVTVSDSYPEKYLSYMARLHRWIRGDWQLAGRLKAHVKTETGSEKNPLSLLSRYKIFDNLRRSVLPYVTLRLVTASLLLPAPYSYIILVFVFMTGAYNLLSEIFCAAKLRMKQKISPKFNANIIYGVKRALTEFVLNAVLLVYESYVSADAIIRAMYRMFISKKKLLSWVTAEETEKKAANGYIMHYKRMWISPAFGFSLILLSPFTDETAVSLICLILGTAWVCAPYIANAISTPVQIRTNMLKDENRKLFGEMARRMWGYFEDYSTEEHNWLAPDNVQFEPVYKEAPRTSPTNIGLLIAATLCARDFGYISTLEMVRRMEKTLNTAEKLEKWHGHLLNWYNTKTLEAMEPRYVSAVDSGNYVGDLIMTSNGIREYKNTESITKKHIRALCDTIMTAQSESGKSDIDISGLQKLLREKTITKKQCIKELEKIAGVRLCERGGMYEKAVLSAQRLKRELENTEDKNLLLRIENLALRMKKLADDTDFAPLYDEKRQLFSIGYDLAEEKLNNSYYDLLMSEARQTSYIAVARGDVSYKHWFRLGRNMATSDLHIGLMSWSGTMFEYLMPLLLIKNYKNTIFDESYNFMLREQIKYCMEFAPVYGVSESGYYSFDAEMNYAYKAFGIPLLSFKRGMENEKVIAPYASVMSSMLAPNTAAENAKNLAALGAYGKYGLYEALDFTKRRLKNGENVAAVKSYMVHHIGMSMLALCNLFYENILQKRFMRDSEMRASSYLLEEKIPLRPNISRAAKYGFVRMKTNAENSTKTCAAPCVRTFEYKDGGRMAAHILSGKNSLMYIDFEGCGYTEIGGKCINRPPAPDMQEPRGFFVFISCDAKEAYPNTFLRDMKQPDSGYVSFYGDKTQYFRCDGKVDTKTEIMLCPEDSVQLHKITLTNHDSTDKTITLTFYSEIILAKRQSDEAHRAFSNLFVSTQYDEERGELFAVRHGRDNSEKPVWACLGMASDAEFAEKISVETDREKFLGRNNTIPDADALKNTLPLSGTAGDVLDSVFAMRVKIRLKAESNSTVNFIVSEGESKQEAEGLCSKYKQTAARIKACEQALSYCNAFSGFMDMRAGEEEKILELLPYLNVCSNVKQRYADKISENILPQSGLWRFSVSGDNKIVLAEIKDENDLFLLRRMLKIYKYCNVKGFAIDVVLLCDEPHEYGRNIVSYAREQAQSHYAGHGAGGIYIISRSECSEDEINLLYTAAALVIDEKQPFMPAYHGPAKSKEIQNRKRQKNIGSGESIKRDETLLYYNGTGGFDDKNGEYVIYLKDGKSTPMPWSNILANEKFGAVVTESGGGFCFDKNSALNKITEWKNDAVSDVSGEMIYIKDDNDVVFSPMKSKINKNGTYKICHGIGYSTFFHNENELNVKTEVFVPHDAPIKFSLMSVKNTSEAKRNLTFTYILRPIMDSKFKIPCTLVSKYENGALKVKNVYNGDFSGEQCFVCATIPVYSYSADGEELCEKAEGVPAAIYSKRLSGRTGAGLDCVMSVAVRFEIGAKEEKQFAFMLSAADESCVNDIIAKYKDTDDVINSLAETKEYWRGMTGGIQVKTPDKSLDIMINSRLLYQSAACRLYARSAFYQCGGAFGFRDQLQDVLAFMHHEPQLAKKQILYHCAHQFEQGDVLHWWHSVKKGNDRGIRTRFSDDLLWLAYVSLEYISITGDEKILDEQVPFVCGEELAEGVDEMYYEVGISENTASLYEHIMLAVQRALKIGAHGLLLMGSGDWNDGMNKIGSGGKGESVWLTWFMCDILKKLISACEKRGENKKALELEEWLKKLTEAANNNAWDGMWYLRAFYDDGESIGSSKNDECKIDLIAQAWAAISGAGEKEKVLTSLNAVYECLADRQNSLIKLLTPPFGKSGKSPGYIAGYVAGVRENGGQYTHAAVWAVIAEAICGSDRAYEYFKMINPINLTKTPMGTARYKTEPYAVSADIYTNSAHIGRGGWSFYTGASSWYYKAGVEYILGIKRKGAKLYMKPCVSSEWEGFEVIYKYGDSEYHIKAVRDRLLKKGSGIFDLPCGEYAELEKGMGKVDITFRFN